MLRFDGEKTISLIWLLMKKDKKKSLLFSAYFYARSEIGKNDISILRRRSTIVYLTRYHTVIKHLYHDIVHKHYIMYKENQQKF